MLLQSLTMEMGRVEGSELVAVIRDAFLVSVMWETQCRGANAGSWRLEQLRVSGGEHALLHPSMSSSANAPTFHVSRGAVLI